MRYRGRHVYTISENDVGKRWIKVGGNLRENPLGVTLPIDIGKQVYQHDGVLSVENTDQLKARMLAERVRA